MQHIGARTGSGPRDRGPPWFTLVPARDVAHLRRARGQLMIGFGAARSESGKGCGVKALRVRDILVLAPLWVWPVLAAPFVGSFLGVVVTRARVPQSILVGRSACARCGHRLGPADLVPLAGWLPTPARLRQCRHSIGALDPPLEPAGQG